MTVIGDPWAAVRSAIDAGRGESVAPLVRALPEDGRLRVAGELPRYWRNLPEPLRESRRTAVLAAGAGCLESPAAAATWLMRRDLRDPAADSAADVLEAVAGRPPAWRMELGGRLAARLGLAEQLRGRDGRADWGLAAGLIGPGGARTPAEKAFTAGWVSARRGAEGRAEDDPWFSELALRVFEIDGLGVLLDREPEERSGWLRAFTRHPDRGAVLDGLMGRLLRGGTPAELRWFVRLHEAMDPDERERSARLGDYLGMLASGPAPVADLAFRQIRLADAWSPLSDEEFAEAAESLMDRREKRLVRDTLAWMERSAHTPARSAAAVRAAVTGFGHEDLDLRERAVRLAAAHLDDPADVAEAATGLPSGLRRLLGLTPGRSGAVPPPRPRPPAVTELDDPIRSAAELADAVAERLATPDRGWAEGERLLAGLVTHGPDAAERLEVIVRAARPWILTGAREYVRGTNAVLRSLIQPSARPHWARLSLPPERRLLGDRDRPVPELVVSGRFDEAARRLGEQPILLATPTHSTGHVDPDVLTGRLGIFEREGVEPGPLDLEQALLRLPRSAGPTPATRALRSAAGRRLHAVLSEGPPEPVVTIGWPGLAARWDTASVTGSALGEIAYREPRGPSFPGGTGWWPPILPSHPDLVAAHLLAWADRKAATFAPTVEALTDAGAPAGKATATVLLLALAGERPDDRAAGVRGLLAAAAHGSPSAAVLGEALADAVEEIKLNRLARSASEAIRGGADLWPMFRAALPALLPVIGERPRAGLPEFVAAATLNAELHAVTDSVPGLRSVTSRGGSSRLVGEATGLERALSHIEDKSVNRG
ncbi:DUF6493 family protein [Actinocorallia longicatena]|uniref:DUF6493 family protein n=1 Tax=Actinocorallia longicatena TaxID=111803 RepID=A0ABP6PWW9_9ACTN